MVGILDRNDGPGARTVADFKAEQPETQGGGTAQCRPGLCFVIGYGPHALVTGDQFAQTAGINTPVVGDNGQIKEQGVAAGKVKVEYTAQLLALPQNVVAEEIAMNDALRQFRVILSGLKFKLGE